MLPRVRAERRGRLRESIHVASLVQHRQLPARNAQYQLSMHTHDKIFIQKSQNSKLYRFIAIAKFAWSLNEFENRTAERK